MSISSQSNNIQQTRSSFTPRYPSWQRALLAACIILAPLSITLYLVADDGIGARAEALNLRRTVNRRRRADMDSEGCRSASPQSVDG